MSTEVVKTKHYPDVDPKPNFPDVEARTLEHWHDNEIFERSVEARPHGHQGDNEYVFYDGPPFANGLPHYGHLLTGYVKDIVPRYETMKGRRVERRFGWDCHGLPAELEAERQLGVSGRADILKFGMEKFNKHCQSSVLQYTDQWESYVTRQARWVDFSHDYKTMDLPYMESVMWAFKQLYDKGLIYEGHRVLPYSWKVESPLSNFETRLDNAYRERQDPAITVLFTLDPKPGDDRPLKVLVWTTTPWTLPSNLALAVGEDIDYDIYDEEGVGYIVGSALAKKYKRELKKATKVGTIKGRELVGRTYQPLFDFFQDTPNAFQVLSGDFVNVEEGTGTVHMAPGFGEDDQVACEAAGIPVICPVDHRGQFTSEVPPYAGKLVFDANPLITKDLKERGILIRHDSYVHSYPHCWRTDEPLIYKAMPSWYVRVTEFRDRMVELNQQIRWVPDHIRDGAFGNWLAGARDWSISRNRFWGAPIPVWKSDDPQYPRVDVYGSLDELERDFGVRPDDLHRPGIDQLTRPNPDDPTGKSTMRRVEDVLDCWFESGSMPFAQVHYPFEHREWFEHHNPADFIVEYIGQTRGWFYTLMVLSTALFDRPPFLNCICHGVVLDHEGNKISKRKQNYPDPVRVFDSLGADPMRWFLVSSTLMQGGEFKIAEDDRQIREVVRRVINPIWNAYYFFSLYANTDGIEARWRTDSSNVLDRYILAKTAELVRDVDRNLSEYNISGACATGEQYIDALTNWYIRRSRDRFWGTEGDADDTQAAFDTLYTVLTTICRVFAPLLPLLMEDIYRGLTGEVSVHLTDWPSVDEFPAEDALVQQMDRIREICSVARAIRAQHSLRVRLPLAKLTYAGRDAETLKPHLALVEDEVNVKAVELADDVSEFANFQLRINAKVLGPRIGGAVQNVIKESKQGNWKRLDEGRIEVAGQVLEEGEFDLTLQPRSGVVAEAIAKGEGLIVLEVNVTPKLEAEGIAKDLIRVIQDSRKQADLNVDNRIALALDVPQSISAAVDAHRDLIMKETLALELTIGPLDHELESFTFDVQGESVTIGLRVVSA